jgi:hypothetical protein
MKFACASRLFFCTISSCLLSQPQIRKTPAIDPIESPMISGKTLMKWGYEPGPWFKGAIAAAEATQL